jgi:hypothetical protein
VRVAFCEGEKRALTPILINVICPNFSLIKGW